MAEGSTGRDLEAWLIPFLAAMGRKTRRTWAPLYLRGLLGPGDRKSLQPMAGAAVHDPSATVTGRADDLPNRQALGGTFRLRWLAGYAVQGTCSVPCRYQNVRLTLESIAPTGDRSLVGLPTLTT